jgi:DNA-binding GntR family transcriptional regulator
MTTIPAVDRRVASLRGSTYAILKQLILDGRLKPGAPLVEDQLCRELQISRTPLREVLGRLEQEGLITIVPYKGATVTPITVADLREIFQVREPLDVLSVQLAWPRLATADLDALAAAFEEARAAIVHDADDAAHRRTDWALHGLLIARSENALLARTLQGLHERVVRCQLGTAIGPARAAAHRRASYDEHHRIVATLQARDVRAAQRSMRSHVRAAGARLVDGLTHATQRPAPFAQDQAGGAA